MTITELLNEIDSLCDSNSTSYPTATKLRRLNSAYEESVGDIIGSDGTWQFDDTNYSTFPIGYATLVNGQRDYTFDSGFLKIEQVRVLDVNGIWHKLDPIDKQNISIPMEEYMKEPGLPLQYDKSGSSIILYPAPKTGDVTMTAGLRVDYQRTASVFTTDDVNTGTKQPGFASPFHSILAYKAAIPYCMTYEQERVSNFENRVAVMKRDLLNFYAKREKDVRTQATMKPIRFI